MGIGASAGALEALESFFSHLPSASGLSFVIVQHLERHHPSMLAELVGRHARIPVQQAEDGAAVEPNRVYVIPPNAMLTLEQGRLRVARPAESGSRNSVDAFFCSLAKELGESAVGIVLSGTGSDGTVGLRAIKEHGGLTFAQSPETAKYDGMPQSAIDAGLVDFVSPVEDMPALLLECLRQGSVASRANAQALDAQIAESRPRICALLQERTGHDFSRYKDGTLLRRIRRRVLLRHAASAAEYMRFLKKDPEEAELLLKDLLIGVTQFFRDPEAFEVLADRVLPNLLEGKPKGDRLRIWVPGCSSGDEAYSIAMLVHELLEERDDDRMVQIFATDIDAEMLARARQGRYTAEIAEQFSAERLRRFFVSEKNTYQASRQLREMCVFSEHNLIRDPPFSSLDLISCRNVLIYLEADLQKKLIPLFHYALRPGGYLFLGPSEGLAAHVDLFKTVDKKPRLFQRKEVAVRPAVEFPLSRRGISRITAPAPLLPSNEVPTPHPVISQAFERMLLEEHLPPCAVINESGEILSSAGRPSRYLRAPVGAPSNNLLEQAQGNLRTALRTALLKAAKTQRSVVREDISVEARGSTGRVRLTVRPLPGANKDAGLYAVLLDERAADGDLEAKAAPDDQPLISHLEDELRTTRADLQAVVEELESANEELKSSNEELISTNEELQSGNEELQTSKEEIQSINDELQRKVEQLGVANSDLSNLFASTHVATLFLDRQLRIAKFTPAATALFRLLESDVGRPIADFAPRFQGHDLVADAREVLESQTAVERQVQTDGGKSWFVVRVLPYRTVANEIAGVVITFVDVTALKRSEEALRESEKRAQRHVAELEAIFIAQADSVMVYDLGGRCVRANAAARALLGFDPTDQHLSQNMAAASTEGGPKASATSRALRGETVVGAQFDFVSAGGERRRLLASSAPMRDGEGGVIGAVTVSQDITDLKRAEEALRENETLLRSFFDSPGALRGIVELVGDDILFVSVNAAAADLYGRPPEEVRGRRATELDVPSDIAQAWLDRYRESQRTNQAVTFEILRPVADGKAWFSATVSFLGTGPSGHPRFAYVMFDVTNIRRAEEALRESKAKLDSALASMTDAVFISDVEGRFIDFNDAFATFHRFPNKEACAKTLAEYPEFLDVFMPDGTLAPLAQWAVPRALRGERVTNAEYTLRRKDTGETWVGSYSFAPVRNEHGAVVGSVVVGRDITEVKRAEEALRKSQRLLADVLDGSPMPVFLKDLDGRFLTVNKRLENLLGLTREQLKGKTDYDIISKDNADLYREHDLKVIESKHPVVIEETAELVDGRHVYLNSKFPLVDSAGQVYGIGAISHDITERKRAEEALHVQSSMAMDLLDALDTAAVLRVLAQRIYSVADGAIVIVNEFDPRRQTLTVRNVQYTPKERERIVPILGRDPEGLVLDFPGETRQRWMAGELAPVPGLHEMSFGQIPIPVCDRLAHELALGDIFGMACAYEEDILGSVAIMTRGRGPLRNQRLIEALVAEAALALKRIRADLTRRESEERYRLLTEHAVSAVAVHEIVLDAAGQPVDYIFRSANPAFESHTGLRVADILGRRVTEVLPGVEKTPLIGIYGKVALTGEPTSFEQYFPPLDRHYLITAYRVGEGRFAAAFTDITKRKRAEEALERSRLKLAEVLDSIQDDFYVLDRNWTFTFASTRFTSRIGKAPSDFIGQNIWKMFPKHLGTAYEENLRAAMERRETRRFEIDGKYTRVWYRMTASPSSEGISVLGTEITENKRMEEALRDVNGRLVEADARKNEFLGVLSHELRNPLTPIRNSLYILDRATPGGDQARRAHSVIDRQVGHLSRLVDDLLDVTRITRGKIRLQRTRLDLVDVVRRTVEDHRSLLEEHDVAIELPSEAIWIDGDPTRLAQVLGNLLNNAAKFTPADGTVSVSLRPAEGRAVLEVADTGMGIDSDTLKRLFEPFAQADRSLDRSRGGLGLGLALVKGMVELHGGEVSAHSDGPGRGARFTIHIPIDTGASQAHRAPPSNEVAGTGRTVLIIEDNRDAADSLSEALEILGHRVAVAYDGETGLAKARELHPDVVLCDIGLPAEMDGYAVARALRQEAATSSAFLVALTGYALPEDQRRAMGAGFDAHLAKPPDLAALERLLKQAPDPHSGTQVDGGPSGLK